ncbi:MAG: LysM peptidoglycan-binding domain-containing protein [Anaerolineae bacterium]|nr:LysM peptidoglycan-binding domain-containing protein [Anaerolineae bacterium]
MMRKALLLGLIFLIAVPLYAQDGAGDLLNRVNALRASVGRAGYSLNGALSAAAQQQAQWMIDTGSVSHTHPDGSGPRTRAQNAGYPSNAISENIYAGSNASVDSAWTFWINSGIHYAGLVNPAYTEVGIGIAAGDWGRAYVMVFGNPNGYGYAAAAPAVSAGSGGGSGSSSGGGSGAVAPPSFVVGTDERGNIQHQVQPGDTLGDIALIYGYTWADLPRMMELNGMADVRDLEVGSIFLVPPHEGTYTPTVDPNTPTPAPTATPLPPTITPFSLPTATPTAIPMIPTAGLDITPPVEVVQVLDAPTPEIVQPLATAPAPQPRNNNTMWLVIALGVQVVVLVGAGAEFLLRRSRRR